jgi:hypothetical protein
MIYARKWDIIRKEISDAEDKWLAFHTKETVRIREAVLRNCGLGQPPNYDLRALHPSIRNRIVRAQYTIVRWKRLFHVTF